MLLQRSLDLESLIKLTEVNVSRYCSFHLFLATPHDFSEGENFTRLPNTGLDSTKLEFWSSGVVVY